MIERELPRMQTQRRIVHPECLRIAENAAREIRTVAAHRKAEMPQMHPDLIRAPREWPCFQQRAAIVEAFQHLEVRARDESVLVDDARACLPGDCADRRIAA